MATAGCLAFLAMRPVGPVDRALDGLLAPTAFLGKLAAPLAWLQGRAVHAGSADEPLRRRMEEEQQATLQAAVVSSATPGSQDLRQRLARLEAVRAEVIGRSPGDRDRVLVRMEKAVSLHDGLPVVSGDAFVGLVDWSAGQAADLPGDVIEVRLVTGPRFRVGGRIRGRSEAGRMVVGGVASRGRGVFLDVHNPEDRRAFEGRVVVGESAALGGYAHLANGFVLGDLVDLGDVQRTTSPSAQQAVCGLRPILDYAHGLHQVLILTERPAADTTAAPEPQTRAEGSWSPARFALWGEISPWRQGRKLSAGSRAGIRQGAALASGVRLVGRVLRCGPYSADVALLTDEGLRLSAIAMLQLPSGDSRAHVLGELTSAGPGRGASVLLRWPATLPLATTLGPGPVRARIWTGSGDSGVPRGLLVGETELPSGAGPHLLEVRPAAGTREPRDLSVWTAGQEGP